jgi:AcrR family transcriptional regulator
VSSSSPQLVREPQQARSRRSFDRALDAAVSLLVERGTASFTLIEVARTAGISTGSIYGRVASKDDLIRAAHAREMVRLSADTKAAFAVVPRDGDEADVVRAAVLALAELLERNAPVLSPFMLLSIHDAVIASAGKAAYGEMVSIFEQILLNASADRGLRRRRDVSWACAVAYSVLARQLALGTDPGAAVDFDLDQVVRELSRMITAYLAEPAG